MRLAVRKSQHPSYVLYMAIFLFQLAAHKLSYNKVQTSVTVST